MKDIPDFGTFRKIEPITKGRSNDKKFFIETFDHKRMLLRLTDIKEFDRKKIEYEMMERIYQFDVLSPKPYSFGLCDGGKSVYSLSEWLEGEDAESALPRMNETEQYSAGVKAGVVLRKIHTLPAPDNAEPWDLRFENKVQTRIKLYHKHRLKSESGNKIIKYLQDNQGLLKNRPQTFWHGAFETGNQMIMPDGEVGTIDFNYWILGYGDPWFEFITVPWGKEPIAHHFTGMINGYFDNDPPYEFFKLLSCYFACDALSALCYTFMGIEHYRPEDGRQHMDNILRWFDDMNNPIPTWYKTDFSK